MITKYLLILIIGHLIGDFYFQNEKTIKYKDKKYKNVLLHSLKYYIAVILVILPVFSLDMFLAAIYAALTHFLIDTIEYVYLINSKNIRKTELFTAHQCAHLTSILILAYIMECWNFSIGHIEIVRNILNVYNYNPEILIRWILAILFIHSPVNTFIQNFLAGYKPDKDNGEIIIKTNNKAGRRIGTVERMIMLIFLSLDQYTAIGFVLTAKSVARYDKITKDEKFAEYYLLGTLISTLCVILCRILILK